MSIALKIPNFIKAKSPEALRRLMLANNAKYGAFFPYDIMFANGEWVAWYYRELNFTDAMSLDADMVEVKKGGK
jgi:hypothetical protein